jgi:predicted RND superfamily exporter protein/photosystem II stability/assembly factor-like uncharacterized protein
MTCAASGGADRGTRRAAMVARLEALVFRNRLAILILLGAVTLVMGWYASQLRMDAGFAKQLPREHEYIQTFFEYEDQLFGSNRVIVALRAREGNIWSPAFLARLQALTDDVFFLPGVDRRTVTSLWTPNTRYFEITEEGMLADDVVPSHVLPDALDAASIALIRDNVIKGGFVGRLVSNDYTAAMVTADLLEVDPATEEELDYLGLAETLEREIREKYVDDRYDMHILGFVRLIGDIADGARSVVRFFGLAFLLTAAAVFAYSRSWVLTVLPLGCSLVSVIWQFGAVHLMGLGLDPLAVLVPFLVFAIGVSHGVQQINLISQEVCRGADSETAARRSFSGLLVPGSMALVTDLVGFWTLVLVPIDMIQELGITATVGVAFKILTNLVLLPILVSYCRFDAGYVERFRRAREQRERWVAGLARIAEPRHAIATVIVFAFIFGLALSESRGRRVGDVQAGSGELHADSRYNVDARTIVDRFSLGLDVLTVIVETPPQACIDYEAMQYVNRFSWHMQNVPGVLSVISAPYIAKLVNSGWTEGNLKWRALPRNRYALGRSVLLLDESSGLIDVECTLMPVYVFTEDHRAETIERAIAAVDDFRTREIRDDIRIRLASGNVGVLAAINEELEAKELLMLAYVYAAVILLVSVTHRDWRATLCCCAPLSVATALGYWFMKETGIGLKVATMPVMVLTVGLGVDYAFYIYNRLQRHIRAGMQVTLAYRITLSETGIAVIFTAITMAVGVSTWSFSELKFQADMGLLLTFMFAMNMVMAVTLLPALAVLLDLLLPRRREEGRDGRKLHAAVAIALALGTGTALFPAATRAQDEAHALPSRLATESLLLDVATAGDRLVAVGEWGHVLLSDDAGASWRQARTVPTRVVLTGVCFVDAELGWAVGHDATVIHTRDGGETWQRQFLAPSEEVPLLTIWFADAGRGIAAGGFGLAFETQDGGRSWQRRQIAGSEEDPHLSHLFAGPGSVLMLAAEAGSAYRSDDGGAHWERVELPYPGSFWGGLTLESGAMLLFGMRGHAFRSEDAGRSWRPVETGTDQSLQGATQLSDGTLVMVGLGGALSISHDDGRSFSAHNDSDRTAFSAVAEGPADSLLLFGEAGVRTRRPSEVGSRRPASSKR